MKILFVISKYYPKIGGTPGCVRNIAKTIKKDHDVQILTTWDKMTDPSEVLCDGIRVHKVRSYKHIALGDFLKAENVSAFRRFMAVMKKAMHRVLHLEDKALEKQFAKRLKKLQESERFDWVVAVSGDIVPAKAVLSSKKLLRNICFYQLDPYTTNTTLPLSSQDKRCELEKKIHQSFDLIFTTDIIKNEMLERFTLGDNVRVCNFPTIVDRTNKEKKPSGEEISFLYCGAMYSARNADFCLGVMDEMTRLDPRFVFDFYIVGDTSGVKSYSEKNPRIHLHPPVSPDKIHGIMSDHDVLINIGNVMTNQVPSKVYDYISTGLPIVNFIQNDNCPTVEVLEKYPTALTVSSKESKERAAASISGFLSQKLGQRVEYPLIEKLYLENTVTYVADMMVSNMLRQESGSI